MFEHINKKDSLLKRRQAQQAHQDWLTTSRPQKAQKAQKAGFKGLDSFPDNLDPDKALGFSEHVIVGRVGHLWYEDYEEHQVINCRVAVSPWSKRKPQIDLIWYEVSLWETQAHAFKNLNFKVGDQVLFRLDNIRAEAWVDSEGNIKTTIKGAADKFMDLRPTYKDCRQALRTMDKNDRQSFFAGPDHPAPAPAESSGPKPTERDSAQSQAQTSPDPDDQPSPKGPSGPGSKF
ncbi:MAG: hypothetical protein LBE80_09685 [Deltaproteobacteria bacterium]|jgi:hypothetical protein|nr:hypothetical protein [Deltaproteobacteria bacterium]